jgi:hypothetical protein
VGGTCGTHGEGRDVYRVLVRRTEVKRPLGDVDVGGRIALKYTLGRQGSMGVNWIRLAQDRVKWRDFVKTVINLWVP